MEKEIDIDRQKIVTYWRVMDILLFPLFLLIPAGIGVFIMFGHRFFLDTLWLILGFLGITLFFVPVAYILAFHFYPWFYRKRVNALRYCFVNKALRIESGLLFRSRKTIPYEKITSLELEQGPILRYFDTWIINVQTASTGSGTPEAVLLGVIHPKQVRDEVFAARDKPQSYDCGSDT